MGFLGEAMNVSMSLRKLTLVKWLDVSHQVGIVDSNNFDNEAVLYTIGHLVSENDKFINLALSENPTNEGVLYTSLISIPVGLVISKKTVKPKKKGSLSISDKEVLGCIVKYLDASKHDEITDTDQFQEGIECWAFGAFLHEDDKCISVAQDTDGNNFFAREVFHIPKSCILDISFAKFKK